MKKIRMKSNTKANIRMKTMGHDGLLGSCQLDWWMDRWMDACDKKENARSQAPNASESP